MSYENACFQIEVMPAIRLINSTKHEDIISADKPYNGAVVSDKFDFSPLGLTEIVNHYTAYVYVKLH